MKYRKLLWKVPLAITGVAIGIVLLLLSAVTIVLYVPSVRHAVLYKSIAIVNERTDMDIDLGGIYLSPFHHSPKVLYLAYKGKADLPIQIEIDNLFIGHRGVDTLLYTHKLRLHTTLLTANRPSPLSNISTLPIVVEQLLLNQTTIHSDSLIEAVGIDAVVNNMELSSPNILLAEGKYPLHGLKMRDASIAIDLRDSSSDSILQDTMPLLMVFDVPDGELRNVRFKLTPLDMDVFVNYLSTNTIADVGASKYDVRQIDVGGLSFSLGSFHLPADTVYGNAFIDLENNYITSQGLHVRSDDIGAKADLHTTEFNMGTMTVNVIGKAEYQGSKAHLYASYNIDSEAYNMHVDVEKVNLAPFLHDSTPIILAGEIDAVGQGIELHSRAMQSQVDIRLKNAVYGPIDASGLCLNARLANQSVEGTLQLPIAIQDNTLKLTAQTEHQFRVSNFLRPEQMSVNYHSQMQTVRTRIGDLPFVTDHLTVDFATDTTTSFILHTKGLEATFKSPTHILDLVDRLQPLIHVVSNSAIVNSITSLQNITMLDTIRQLIPAIQADIEVNKGSLIQPIIENIGLDIDKVTLMLSSNSLRTDMAIDVSLPEIYHPEDSTALHLPALRTTMRIGMTEGSTTASLNADIQLTNGVMNIYDICTDAKILLDLTREENTLHGYGKLTMDNLSYNEMNIGNRSVDIHISPSRTYEHAVCVDVQTEDIPIDIVDGIFHLPDIALHGVVKANALVDGLPHKTDISAEIYPLGVSAKYNPYGIGISLGETPIVMKHNHVGLNGLKIYGVDSTYIALNGGLDMNNMMVDVSLTANSFIPTKLEKDGPIPVYGKLFTDISGQVSGPLDSIIADVDVTVLPTTDITYPIDKRNIAQVNPQGIVNVRYATTDGILNLGGQINIDDGIIRYSPKMYPVMPFHVDSGSHITFQGPIGRTLINVSASQTVKADVESSGEDTRRVDFTTGVRVNGELDSIGLQTINFFLEAPYDETITSELTSMDENTREGLAATLLATGLYVGESNVAAQREGYALSSIINSRINAAMANSQIGKFMEVDIGSGQNTHTAGKTNDMNIAISKSFLRDKLNITIGSTISDNPEVNKTNGLLSNITADYKLTKDGDILLRLFSQRDYNNILEGELCKSGIAVQAKKEWHKQAFFRTNSITRTYNLTADAGVAYRSNNSIGPDLTLKSSIKNLLGNNEIFTVKGNGAYYWALRNRHPGDPKKTDTYKLGVSASLVFPYLHWVGSNKPNGDTRYLLGYQYENIAGGYGVHKLSGSFTYFIRSSQYITHAFTPFSLSIVKMKAGTDDLLDKAAEYPQLIKILAGDELVPSVGYTFTYNDYRSKRAINTMFELGVKESGNLVNALYCAFGYKWDKTNKPLGAVTFNQFVKLTAELRNQFNITDRICIATRLFAGANIPIGNSTYAPLSEAFYTGGPNSLRASAPYAYGPGNFYSAKYNQNFFHAGDIKFEANIEFRFPIVWKLYGATFVDAGNVWNWYSAVDLFKAAGYEDYLTRLDIPSNLYDGLLKNPEFLRQIALGTGVGLRLDIDGLVVRLDLGVGIHAPYQTFRYNKEGKIDTTRPIRTYVNLPSVLDALRINFGIGYPF